MLGFPLDSRVTYVTDPDTGVITPQYDRAVTSKPLREYIRGIVTTGVLPNPSDNLQVFPGTDGMTVIVHAGFAVIDGGLAKEDNNRTLEVTASDATYDRIDTVVVRWNDNDSVRNVDLYIKQGVPARNPVRPALTREGSVYEIGLADIFVTKNVRTITNEKITDTRMESARCGIVSSVSEWDTTTIYQQIQSDLAGFKSNEQAEFMTWFNKMKDQLSEDAAGHLQNEIDKNTKDISDVDGRLTKDISDVDGRLTQVMFNNAGAHNAIYRGKNLGTSVTAEQWAVITAGTFDDLYIGDYWVINGKTWRIAAFDYFLHNGDTECTTHHAVIVSDECLYNAQMNTTNDTVGGYFLAKYRGVLTAAETAIKATFGTSHILSHRVYLTNAVANGKPSGGAWVDTICDLMNEEMVYGTGIFRPTSDGSTVPANYRVEKSQLPLFAHEPSRIINRANYWLGDVVTAAYFAYVNFSGLAAYSNASDSFGVRPAFCIS